MEPTYISIASALIALAAFGLSMFHEIRRRRDQARLRTEESVITRNSLIREEVMKLFIASETVGLRTVDALGSDDSDEARLQLLRRTGTQLRVVGHKELASALECLCDAWQENPEKSELKRKFIQKVEDEMRIEP